MFEKGGKHRVLTLADELIPGLERQMIYCSPVRTSERCSSNWVMPTSKQLKYTPMYLSKVRVVSGVH
jgi:hypothetical protein